MECNKEKNLQECNCTYGECSRKGICCKCIKYHHERRELPACYFSKDAEASYDRSISKFVEDQKRSSN